MGLSVLVVLVYCIAVALVLGGFAAAAAIRDGAFHFGEFAGAIATNGLVQSLSVLAAAVACCAAMVLFVRWRRAGTVRDYLALRAVPWPSAAAMPPPAGNGANATPSNRRCWNGSLKSERAVAARLPRVRP